MKSQRVETRNAALLHAIVDSRFKTHGALARRLRISKWRFSKILNNREAPTKDQKDKIARALGKTPAELGWANEPEAIAS